MVGEYLLWHYRFFWPKALSAFRLFFLFPIFYLSLPLHLTHFFSPWKRQKDFFQEGPPLSRFFSNLTFNLTSCLIGMILRSVLIFLGFSFSLIFFFLGLPFLFFVFPPGSSLLFYILWRQKKHFWQKILKVSFPDFQKLALLLFSSPQGQFILKHLTIDPAFSISFLRKEKWPVDAKKFSQLFPLEKNWKGSDLFFLLTQNFPPLALFFEKKGVKPQEIQEAALWYEDLSALGKKKFLDEKRLKNLPGIGIQWAYGFTPTLDKFAQDLNREIPPYPLLIGREKEIQELEGILLKNQYNNALLIGEPGVTRHLILRTLAQRAKAGEAGALSHKRFLSLSLPEILAARKTLLEAKGLFWEILKEAEAAGNIVLVIDYLDKFMSEKEERVDLSEVIAQVAESSVGLIGITSPLAYHQFLENNPTISLLFEKIFIEPPSPSVILQELKLSIAPVLERKYGLTITLSALKKIVEDAQKYLTQTPFPAKAIELLEESVVFCLKQKKGNVLLPTFVEELLAEKLKIRLGALREEERKKLLHLESWLHQNLVNQDEAVKAISDALRRQRLTISSENRPIGSFLFLGPTGVGKTETAKTLARIYFGSEESLIRFDMSQYQKEEGLERLIGSKKFGFPGELTSALLEHPFSLLLFDEFEKADPLVYNLFLPLLDEGYLPDAFGKKINARNSLIIATSNAGAEFIREQIILGNQGESLAASLLEYLQREKIFSPELLNRFDSVIVFRPLSEGHLREVVKLQLQKLNQRLARKEITVAITDELVRKLVGLAVGSPFGAREIKRAIAEKIESQIARKLLLGQIKRGEEIKIDF